MRDFLLMCLFYLISMMVTSKAQMDKRRSHATQTDATFNGSDRLNRKLCSDYTTSGCCSPYRHHPSSSLRRAVGCTGTTPTSRSICTTELDPIPKRSTCSNPQRNSRTNQGYPVERATGKVRSGKTKPHGNEKPPRATGNICSDEFV